MLRRKIRNSVKRFLFPALKAWTLSRSQKISTASYDGISLLVYPSVFHPRYYLSSEIIIEFSKQLPLEGKIVLELGAGSGMLAFTMARRGAQVYASDINSEAIEGLHFNSKNLDLPISIIQSDLFDSFGEVTFDYIFINPPFYRKAPVNDQEKAFYAGKDLEYFRRLADQLPSRIRAMAQVFMILSEDAEVDTIIKLMLRDQLMEVQEISHATKYFEEFSIITLKKSAETSLSMQK